MQHHLHLQVVDCGKEGLHSTALPVSLPLPTNSISTKEEEEFTKKSSLSKEKLELTNKGPMETSWSLSLSPWRVELFLCCLQC